MDYEVFDIHQHVGALNVGALFAVSEKVDDKTNIDEDCRKRCALMDKCGIKRAAIMPSLQYLRPRGQEDTKEINNMIAQYRNKHSSRFPVAFGTVEPLHGEKLGVQEIERAVGELHLDGFVWHQRMQGTRINDKRMVVLVKKVIELKMPAFIHVMGESNWEAPWGFEEVVEQFPEDACFVALDAFTGITRAHDMINIAKRHPNVLLETAGCFPLGRLIDVAVDKLGSERLLFGTDLYMEPPAWNYPHVLQEVLMALSLSEQDKQNILWKNAYKLLHLK